MIKKYSFNYDNYEGQATFMVDTDKFTNEHAKATLEFFTWRYDKSGNPIDEVLKKYGMEAIKVATFNDFNTYGVISEFKDREGFCSIDGSMGITLTSVSGFEFDESQLEMEVEKLR